MAGREVRTPAGGQGIEAGEGGAAALDAQNVTEWEPSLAEKKLLEVVIDPSNRLKSVTDLCQAAGISRQTYYIAVAKPEFVAYMNAESAKTVKAAGPSVLNAFIREAQRGSYTHGLVILDMAGLYSPKARVEHSGSVDMRETVLSQDEVTARLRSMGLLPAEPAKDTETPH